MVYVDLNTTDYGGLVAQATKLLSQKLTLPPGFTYKWSGEYEFELRAKKRLELILPIIFFVIFQLLYMVFHSVTEAAVVIFPTIYALRGGLILEKMLGYNFSVAAWVGYAALFGIAVETGVVMVVYLHEALDRRVDSEAPLRREDIEAATIAGAVQRLRPKLMTVTVPPPKGPYMKTGATCHLKLVAGYNLTHTQDETVSKRPSGTRGWKIDDSRGIPWTTANTAVRYVLEMRDNTADPTIKKNADETLAQLLKLH